MARIFFLFALTVFTVTGSISGCSKQEQRQPDSKSEEVVQLSPETLERPLLFASAQLPNYVKYLYGLDQAEPFGRWTTGKIVLIEFKGNLPEKFDIELVAGAFGPNLGASVRAIAGKVVREFQVTTEISQAKPYIVEFSGLSGDRGIVLEIAAPTSPAELGKGNDPRKLGLALVSLKIIPKP